MNKYISYLKSANWEIKKNSVLERDKVCLKCGSSKFLQVHHGTYKNLYNENLSELFTLCSTCHRYFHEKYGKGRNIYSNTIQFLGISKPKKAYTIPQEIIHYIQNGGTFGKQQEVPLRIWKKLKKLIKKGNEVPAVM